MSISEYFIPLTRTGTSLGENKGEVILNFRILQMDVIVTEYKIYNNKCVSDNRANMRKIAMATGRKLSCKIKGNGRNVPIS